MDPVRLLIGDDVGIGKTIESALIARELMEQGSARNMTVLCSPSLAEQWQRELRDKFGMEAELVLPSTAARLQKAIDDPNRSIFDHYPVTVVSTDFIKQDERRDAFRRHCPELLIVDEAHTCVGAGSSDEPQKRYELLSALADRNERDRHLILVTATPHSGDPQAFSKLTGLLDPSLRTLDTTRSADRDRLARHFVQRRRHDIKRYVGQDTPFPEDRDTQDALYRLDADYARFVADIIAYTRQQARRPGGDHQQRMSWWTALTLLRCVLSSPAAVAATRAPVRSSPPPAARPRPRNWAGPPPSSSPTTRQPRAWTWSPAPSRTSRRRRGSPRTAVRTRSGAARPKPRPSPPSPSGPTPSPDPRPTPSCAYSSTASSGSWSTATTRSSSATTS
ncbi:DEAD/DEAH box helicase [Streptomyces sp. BPTC-684]|uniref:DEAD/DEAH box helicase n=1 Tax=Streptomyces sp. BPTC-684 TaxID=3043734 RepID=UPI0024B13A5D|nr:DEAD/DEAH box helicase [Streptomyces sp. BPTC-684]WHM39392.1 DEAD/DEAH box helicase [Streptomyces sp. BPTC-684]